MFLSSWANLLLPTRVTGVYSSFPGQKNFRVYIFFNFWFWFFLREEGRVRERETSLCCSPCLCIRQVSLVCALTGDPTHKLGIGHTLTNWATQSGPQVKFCCVPDPTLCLFLWGLSFTSQESSLDSCPSSMGLRVLPALAACRHPAFWYYSSWLSTV